MANDAADHQGHQAAMAAATLSGLRSVETDLRVEFYDCDPMHIVWHGNYVKYMEQARNVLMDDIGYNYHEMAASGYAWPVVEIQIKYIRPLAFKQRCRIRATLADWENRIKIEYLIFDPDNGQKITKASSVQMAVEVATGESQFATPRQAMDKIEAWLRQRGAI